MATKKYKPTTPGLRKRVTLKLDQVTTSQPEKSLTKSLNKRSGRNNTGRITVRHKGGGLKRRYRTIDFKRQSNVEGKIVSIEYDPNRTSLISLVHYKNGEKAYILTPSGVKVGDVIKSGDDVDINIGNAMSIRQIPTGALIHNIELTPGKGAQLVRSAGMHALLMAKSSKYATVKLPSGEIRLILLECIATYGKIGNEAHYNTCYGKAGLSRKRNKRPTVRGSVMNPADHKHGGGEGRAPIGLSTPYTAYGKPARRKTRNKRKNTSHLVRARKR